MASATQTAAANNAPLVAVVDYLRQFYAIKRPPIYDVDRQGLFAETDGTIPLVDGVVLTPAAEAWLTVERLDYPLRPELPSELRPLLGDAKSLSPRNRPTVSTHANDTADVPQPRPAELVDAAERWVVERWEPWSARYLEVDGVKALYERLFEVMQQVNRERELVELVWGFGRVRWNSPAGVVNLPLVIVPVEISSDGDRGLLVRPEGALQVDTGALTGIKLYDHEGLRDIVTGLLDLDFDPWSEELTALVRRVVRCLASDGVLDGEGDATAETPVVHPGWLLYLRRRRSDLDGYLNTLREVLIEGAIPTAPFAGLAGTRIANAILGTGVVEESAESSGSESTDSTNSPRAPARRQLLPKHSNAEQQRIVTVAQQRSGVTVQGPPGTGKSHTIANLISHYVAHGERVLVVSEKEQALRVLSEKLPEPIRPLAISVLGSDVDSRRELEFAVKEIQAGVARVDTAEYDAEIARIERALDEHEQYIARLTNALFEASKAEAEPLPGVWQAGAGATLHPSGAGVWIAQNRERFGYIPDPLPLTMSCPLTADQLQELIDLVTSIGVERAEACGYVMPDPAKLPDGSHLAAMLSEHAERSMALAAASPELADLAALDSGLDHLANVTAALNQELERQQQASSGWLAEVVVRTRDPLVATEWLTFAGVAATLSEQIMSLRGPLHQYDFVLPEGSEADLIADLDKAEQALSFKGKLSMFDRESKRAIEACTIDGQQPRTAAQVAMCKQALQVRKERRSLATYWRNQMHDVSGPDITLEEAEVTARASLGLLLGCLNSPAIHDQLREQLARVGISTKQGFTPDVLGRLIEVCAIASTRPMQKAAANALAEIANYLAVGGTAEDASPLWTQLAAAQTSGATEQWQSAYEQVQNLAEIAPLARHLRLLRDRLRAAAPLWTARIVAKPAAAGQPHDLNSAWEWRQLDTALDELAAKHDPNKTQSQLEHAAEHRLTLVAELVAKSAWRRLVENLGDEESEALRGYVKAVARFGKTGGKYSQRWQADMRSAMSKARAAVPVWIMTTSRALEAFRPAAHAPFDVLIVDEASQIGIESTPLLALARTAIVVGDEKQTSPENPGLKDEAIHALQDQYLANVGIEYYRTLFAPESSLYDISQAKYPNPIMLREHFRCLPEIIAFSSHHDYNDGILALRDKPPRQGWKPLGAIKVNSGVRIGGAKTNEPEADAVVELVAAMCFSPEYDGMDFGVVSLLGQEQSHLIRHKLYQRLGADIVLSRRILVGEAANFQGDERDVVVISTVVAPNPADPKRKIPARGHANDERRVNVAASRAKHQMWVVHSVDPEQIGAGDRRAALIRHCRNPPAIDLLQVDLEQGCNEFERLVLRQILDRGYRVVRTQYPVGQFRIDLVVEGPDRARLAIECDGEQWHGPDRWHADHSRQQIIERAGWTFERIRGSSFFRNPDEAMEPVWARLDALGIPVGDEWCQSSEDSTVIAVDQPHQIPQLLGLRAAPPAVELQESATQPRRGRPPKDVPSRTSTVTLASVAPMTPPSWVGREQAPALAEVETASTSSHEDSAWIDRYRGEDGESGTTPDDEHVSLLPSANRAPGARLEHIVVYRAEPKPSPRDAATAGASRDSPGSEDPSMAAYLRWQPRTLPDPKEGSPGEIQRGLLEIVEAEGPMLAQTAIQVYSRSAGYSRAGSQVKLALGQRIDRLVRSGQLCALTETLHYGTQRTLYAPGTPPVVVRELGDRGTIGEVPRSEIKALIERLGLSEQTGERMQRAVLDAYGLIRLTDKTREYLEECRTHTWSLD